MAEDRYIHLAGELVPFADAKIHVFSPAVRFAVHLFEGIRAYWNGQVEELYVFRLREHLERLRGGMKVMRYEAIPSVEEMAAVVLETIRANGHRGDIGIRFSAYVLGEGFMDARGPLALMCGTEPTPPRDVTEKRTRAMVTAWRRIDDTAMPGRLKSAANYQNGRLGLMEARDGGYDEAIFLTPDGKVAEGAGACLFMVRDGVPITPPVTAGILESVTRETMIQAFAEAFDREVVERPIDRTELYVCEEVFLCGSTYEVHPIVEVDSIPVGEGEIGPLTAGMWRHYEGLIRGTLPDHPDWRTPVWGAQGREAAAE